MVWVSLVLIIIQSKNILVFQAVLERVLRQFACLTTGDTISINYNDREYEIFVLETKPANVSTRDLYSTSARASAIQVLYIWYN